MNELQDNTYCVYVHINKINGKMYIGQTHMKPEYRWNGGRSYKTSTYFYNAIQKYGWDNFEHKIIASNLTLEEANSLEKLLIAKYDTTNHRNGYNLMSGGKNSKHSKETLEKIKNRMNGESHPLYGKCHTEETKRKISESQKKRYSDKHNHPMYGKHLSEDTKQKISNKNKGRKRTEDERIKLSESHKGILHTEETKRKISESRIGAKHPRAKKVIQYDLNNNLIKIWDCMSDVEKNIGLNHTNISACCRGKLKTYGGFIWKYYDEVFPFNEDVIA